LTIMHFVTALSEVPYKEKKNDTWTG
jgi:hypothetical protein